MKKQPDISAEELVAQLKATGMQLPAWMTDVDHIKNGEPLTREESLEFTEIFVGQQRAVLALRYLVSCGERFGQQYGGYVFKHDNVIIQIDQNIIETLLQAQVESAILERPEADGYISVMEFYMMNAQKQEQEGCNWLNDFIDEFLTEGSALLLSGNLQPPAELH
ncbi:hypothetical protein EKN56_12750 [Limnobaculum zhutongyuii]|uniref:Uncharacterized protein n=1 Tax=Limnobaculum zhutongyuii TaxID=2498113 RepID=A0A411WM44_9GAMM|nr:hypothetical protein [Limnobaculum zhutongyuii]QBH97185.1 hypothetical protein EKN56_12750 [Limnobaculum zhutongyuii]TQS88444.1 hypothetical protein ELQ32_10535 [Limnobaculum zhutongyuii]